jgi:hypothetical protein
MHDSFSTMHRQARIVMHVHARVGFDRLDVFTPTTLSNPSPHEQPIETSHLALSSGSGAVLQEKANCLDIFGPANRLTNKPQRA